MPPRYPFVGTPRLPPSLHVRVGVTADHGVYTVRCAGCALLAGGLERKGLPFSLPGKRRFLPERGEKEAFIPCFKEVLGGLGLF